MPSPKSGSAGSAVSPAAPDAAQAADQADPGAVEQIKAQQIQTQSGKYGTAQTQPYKPLQADGQGQQTGQGQQAGQDQQSKKSWIEIEMVDEDNKPVAGMHYRIILTDGSVAEGTLDNQGLARLDGIDPGTCQITFPDLDKEAWEKA